MAVKSQRMATASSAERRGLVTLSLGPDVRAMLQWLARRHMCADGLPASSASAVVRDLIRRAYGRAAKRRNSRFGVKGGKLSQRETS